MPKSLGAVQGLGTWLLPPGAAETPRRLHTSEGFVPVAGRATWPRFSWAELPRLCSLCRPQAGLWSPWAPSSQRAQSAVGGLRPARPGPTSPSGPRLLFVKNNTSQTPAVTDRGEKPRFPAGRHPRQLQGLCPLQILQDTSCSLIAMAWRAHPGVQPPQQGKLWSLLRAPKLKSL